MHTLRVIKRSRRKVSLRTTPSSNFSYLLRWSLVELMKGRIKRRLFEVRTLISARSGVANKLDLHVYCVAYSLGAYSKTLPEEFV